MNELQKLWQYHHEAWLLALEPVQNLSEQKFTEDLHSSFKSLRDTLVHCYGADRAWLSRVRGEAQSWPQNSDYADLETLREAWLVVLNTWPKALLEPENNVIQYKSLKGEPFANTLGEIVRHVVNHGSYHRGQVATMLRQLGETPASTDLILWLRKNS